MLRPEQLTAGETVFVERASEVFASLSLLRRVIRVVNPGLKKGRKGRCSSNELCGSAIGAAAREPYYSSKGQEDALWSDSRAAD